MKNYKIRKKGVGMRLGLENLDALQGRVMERNGETMYIAQVDMYKRNNWDVTAVVLIDGYRSLFCRRSWIDVNAETWAGEIVDENGRTFDGTVVPAKVLIG